jgi:hypothetical protein
VSSRSGLASGIVFDNANAIDVLLGAMGLGFNFGFKGLVLLGAD